MNNTYLSPEEYLKRKFLPDEPLPVKQGTIDYMIKKRRTQQGRMAVVSVLQKMKNEGKIYGTFTLPDPTEV